MANLFLKFLSEDGTACHGGSGQWPLPRGARPGAWVKVKGDLIPCQNGLHLCRQKHALEWLGPALWVAETRGKLVEADTKVVVREARLILRVPYDDKALRLFACDEAERVLPLFEKERPNDKRPREAIEVARRFAKGDATENERSAAESAAESVAMSAAWSTAWSVAWRAAESAARSAAWSAANQRLCRVLRIPQHMKEAQEIIASNQQRSA